MIKNNINIFTIVVIDPLCIISCNCLWEFSNDFRLMPMISSEPLSYQTFYLLLPELLSLVPIVDENYKLSTAICLHRILLCASSDNWIFTCSFFPAETLNLIFLHIYQQPKAKQRLQFQLSDYISAYHIIILPGCIKHISHIQSSYVKSPKRWWFATGTEIFYSLSRLHM